MAVFAPMVSDKTGILSGLFLQGNQARRA